MSGRLVLLHGFTGSPESWAEVRERLEATTFAPALVGHAGTTCPPGIERFEDEVDRLASLIRERGVGRWHIAGYSMGGRVALGLLARHPQLFDGATLIGARAGLSDPAERADRRADDERWARLLEAEGLDTFVAAWEALPLFATQARLPADVRKRQDRIRRSHDPPGLACALRVIGLAAMPELGPALDRTAIPIRLVVGEHDARFRALADDLARRLPHGRVTVVPDAGHNVVLEDPTVTAGLLREDIE